VAQVCGGPQVERFDIEPTAQDVWASIIAGSLTKSITKNQRFLSGA